MSRDKLARITLDLPVNLQKNFKAFAALQGKTMREIIIVLIEEKLQRDYK